MYLQSIFLLVLIFFLTVFGEEILVTLPNGQVRGVEKLSARNHTYYAFFQIPYAEPPLGNLRFQPPQSVKNWNGIFDATYEKSVCYQTIGDHSLENEDCLYLSIYTPVKPCTNASLPVMFYIHGGGFLNGNALFNTSGPHYFMDYDVIIVTIAYRLGPFGFLSTGDSLAPGNNGLRDQNFALKWVKQNIQYFGGDPNKVTIFGQSSGAVSVGYHILSKQSAGLFRGAIQQSGSALTPHGYQRRARDYAYQLANFIDPNFSGNNSTQELVNFLLNTSAKDIDDACIRFTQAPGSLILSEGSFFAPVIEDNHEDAFITERMYESFESGNINRVPLMVGMTSEEALSQAENLDFYKATVEQFDNNVTFLVHADFHIIDQTNKTLAGNAIRKIYTNGLLKDNLAAATKYFSDAYVSRPVIRQADLQNKYTDVYFYQFSYHGALGNNNIYLEGADRVTHSEDTYYLWATNGVADINSIDSNDLQTLDSYLTLFTDFSKTKNPTPKRTNLLQRIIWPKVTSQCFQYLDIGEDLSIKQNPKESAYKGWVSVYNTWAIPPFDTY